MREGTKRASKMHTLWINAMRPSKIACSRSPALEKRFFNFNFFTFFCVTFFDSTERQKWTVNFNASPRQRTPPRDLVAFRGHGTFAHGSWMDTCDNKKRDAMCTV